MPMKTVLFSLLVLMFVRPGRAQKPIKSGDAPQLIRMTELLGNPDHFNGKRISVIGYLVISGQNVNADSTLSLDKEDYVNDLGNGMGVTPNAEMLRNGRELTNMYVIMTGIISTREWPRGRMLAIGDITECKLWSNPEHPRVTEERLSR